MDPGGVVGTLSRWPGAPRVVVMDASRGLARRSEGSPPGFRSTEGDAPELRVFHPAKSPADLQPRLPVAAVDDWSRPVRFTVDRTAPHKLPRPRFIPPNSTGLGCSGRASAGHRSAERRGVGLLQSGEQGGVPLWSLDWRKRRCWPPPTWLDLDHDASVPALNNRRSRSGTRKILLLNTTIHSRCPGHDDYRHGTHTAGTLGCEPVDWNRSELPAKGSLAHGSTLVVVDIVDASGWSCFFDALLSKPPCTVSKFATVGRCHLRLHGTERNPRPLVP